MAPACPVKFAAALVAGACRAAAAMGNGWQGLAAVPADLDVAATVADRLELLRPVLMAQAARGLASGMECHSPAGVADREAIVKANAARRAGFSRTKLL